MDHCQILCAQTHGRRDHFDKFWPKVHFLNLRYGQKGVFSPFFSTRLEISIILILLEAGLRVSKIILETSGCILSSYFNQQGPKRWPKETMERPVSLKYSSNMALLDNTYCHFG